MKFKSVKEMLEVFVAMKDWTKEDLMKLRAILDAELDTKPPTYASIFNWLNEMKPNVVGEKVADVYADYEAWCKVLNMTPVTKTMLSKEILKKFGLESKSVFMKGKTVRVYRYK